MKGPTVWRVWWPNECIHYLISFNGSQYGWSRSDSDQRPHVHEANPNPLQYLLCRADWQITLYFEKEQSSIRGRYWELRRYSKMAFACLINWFIRIKHQNKVSHVSKLYLFKSTIKTDFWEIMCVPLSRLGLHWRKASVWPCELQTNKITLIILKNTIGFMRFSKEP